MGYTVDGQFKKPWKITIWYTVDWYRKFEISGIMTIYTVKEAHNNTYSNISF